MGLHTVEEVCAALSSAQEEATLRQGEEEDDEDDDDDDDADEESENEEEPAATCPLFSFEDALKRPTKRLKLCARKSTRQVTRAPRTTGGTTR